MAKDPAFLFYSQDFYTGVATLTFEERGKFISILCLMHQQGRMSEETIRFIVGNVSDNLKSKFSVDEKGLWYNKRLELETARRNNFTESRRKNGVNGGRPKKIRNKNNPNKNHMDNHMGNENEDVNEIEIINDKKGVQGETNVPRATFDNEGSNVLSDEWFNQMFDGTYLEDQMMTFRNIDVGDQLEKFKIKVKGSPAEYIHRDIDGIRLAFQYQLRQAKPTKHATLKDNPSEFIKNEMAIIYSHVNKRDRFVSAKTFGKL